ncbi:MAG: hypothetical protein Q4B21_05715 [Bacteroidia bacterium]|nr:hypothetical protein [Bacteroidia bacterium]
MKKRTFIYLIAAFAFLALELIGASSVFSANISLQQEQVRSGECSLIIGEEEGANKPAISKEGTMPQTLDGGVSYPTQSLRSQFRRNNTPRGGNAVAYVNDITGHYYLPSHFFLIHKLPLLEGGDSHKFFIKLEKLII